MAKAQLHSLRGQKSALIAVKPNEFALGNTFAYVNRIGVLNALKKSEDDFKVGESVWEDNLVFDIPDGYKFAPIVDENGEVRKAENGEELKQLVW